MLRWFSFANRVRFSLTDDAAKNLFPFFLLTSRPSPRPLLLRPPPVARPPPRPRPPLRRCTGGPYSSLFPPLTLFSLLFSRQSINCSRHARGAGAAAAEAVLAVRHRNHHSLGETKFTASPLLTERRIRGIALFREIELKSLSGGGPFFLPLSSSSPYFTQLRACAGGN